MWLYFTHYNYIIIATLCLNEINKLKLKLLRYTNMIVKWLFPCIQIIVIKGNLRWILNCPPKGWNNLVKPRWAVVAVEIEHSGSWTPCKIGYISFYTPVLSEGFCFTETDNSKFGKKRKAERLQTDVTALTKEKKEKERQRQQFWYGNRIYRLFWELGIWVKEFRRRPWIRPCSGSVFRKGSKRRRRHVNIRLRFWGRWRSSNKPKKWR